MEVSLEEKIKELEKLQKNLKTKLESASNLIEELKCNKREIEKNKDFRRRVESYEGYYFLDLSIDKEDIVVDTVDNSQTMDENNYINYNYFKTEQEAIKYAKIIKNNLKILQTLEYINGEWKPDWGDMKSKYVILINFDCIEEESYYNYNQILSFQSEEKRSQFRQLITDEEIKLFLNPLGEI